MVIVVSGDETVTVFTMHMARMVQNGGAFDGRRNAISTCDTAMPVGGHDGLNAGLTRSVRDGRLTRS